MNANDVVTPIRERRLAAGLSQEKLARFAECSTSTIRLAERGWTPSEAMVRRIAGALQCDPAELDGGSVADR